MNGKGVRVVFNHLFALNNEFVILKKQLYPFESLRPNGMTHALIFRNFFNVERRINIFASDRRSLLLLFRRLREQYVACGVSTGIVRVDCGPF